jgi:16S rRNA (guanine(966)-N(2))-methyltransferase RsmD
MGRIRIIAGEFKGRRLVVPAGRRLRPTAERVREALFSILGSRLAGARVLDAYAGTGALGFEALSRGAGEVVFVESDRAAARLLRDNAERLGVASRSAVREVEAVAWLEGSAGGAEFALILADPPYAADEERSRFLRLAAGRLADGGWLVLEREATSRSAGTGAEPLLLFRNARYGGTCLDFYRHSGP